MKDKGASLAVFLFPLFNDRNFFFKRSLYKEKKYLHQNSVLIRLK